MSRLILVDENIPGAQACFSQFGEVRLFAGRELTAEGVANADALIVRSVTRVNESLLANSRVAFVGSTTIGTDHLDTDWLASRGIACCNAPGSNADSVVDYCLSALCRLPGVLERLMSGGRVGIVGFGNVGSRLFRRLHELGVECLAYDPFLDTASCPVKAELADVLNCDVLSLHTPLTTIGAYPTWHMLSRGDLKRLPENAVLLNAGRGEVLGTGELLALKAERQDLQLVLDVWEGEPTIDPDLLLLTQLATPHIAGYSADGKLRGMQMVAERYAQFLGGELKAFEVPAALRETPLLSIDRDLTGAELVRAVVLGCYDIQDDDLRMRRAMSQENPGAAFDALRKNYPVRRELSACRMASPGLLNAVQLNLLRALGIDE